MTAPLRAREAAPARVQIAFTTRSGTNEFTNSLYHYFKHPSLNSNYYFNKVNGLEKNQVIVHQYGGRSGGPIVIPGLFNGRNRAFYFFNFEHLHQPSEATRTRTILNPEAQRGLFTYLTAGGTNTVDLLGIASRNSQTATLDPTTAAVLATIRTATGTTGSVTTPPNRPTPELRLSGQRETEPVRANRSHRREPRRRAPAHRHLLVAAVPQLARSAEQHGIDVPGTAVGVVDDLLPDDRVDRTAVDPGLHTRERTEGWVALVANWFNAGVSAGCSRTRAAFGWTSVDH